jgi:hypothetical protein
MPAHIQPRKAAASMMHRLVADSVAVAAASRGEEAFAFIEFSTAWSLNFSLGPSADRILPAKAST